MHHYPWHVGDYGRDTAGLSWLEDCAYRRLLDWYYAGEKPLPSSAPERHRIARATAKAERAAVDYIVTRHFVEQPDGWHNQRADHVIAAYKTMAEQARQNGRRGGRRRTGSVTDAATTPDTGQEPDRQANQEPRTITSMGVSGNSPGERTRDGQGDRDRYPFESQRKKANGQWWTNEGATDAKAREVGAYPARAGESWDAYRARIRSAITERERATHG